MVFLKLNSDPNYEKLARLILTISFVGYYLFM